MDFVRGTPRVVKFQFNNPKLRENFFLLELLLVNFKFQEGQGPLPHPSDTHSHNHLQSQKRYRALLIFGHTKLIVKCDNLEETLCKND